MPPLEVEQDAFAAPRKTPRLRRRDPAKGHPVHHHHLDGSEGPNEQSLPCRNRYCPRLPKKTERASGDSGGLLAEDFARRAAVRHAHSA